MASLAVCIQCGVGIAAKRDVVQLEPCGHTVCRDCLLDMEAARGIKQLKCSSCKSVVNRHSCWRAPKQSTAGTNRRRSSGRSKKRKVDESGIVDENGDGNTGSDVGEDSLVQVSIEHEYGLHQDIDAFRIWMLGLMELDETEREDIAGMGGLLVNQMYTVKFDSTRDNKITIQRTAFVVSADGEYFPSEKDTTALVDSFVWLHSALMPISFTPEDDDDDNLFPSLRNPKSLLEYKVNEEQRVLFQLLFSLATGKRDFSKIKMENAEHHRQVFAAAISTDLIVRALDPRKDIGHTTSMLSFQLETSSRTQQTELLCRVGLVTSRAKSYRQKAAQTLQAMQTRLLPDTHGLPHMAADNIHWKDGHGGCIEKTLMLHKNPPTTELAYQLKLSRQWGDWEHFITVRDASSVVEQVWSPQIGDYNLKFEQILTHMKLVLDMHVSGKLLTVEKCREHNAPPYHYVLPEQQIGIPVLHRFAKPDDLNRLENEEDPGIGADDDEGDLSLGERQEKWSTIWKSNHFHPCPLIDFKFSELATMYGILDYGNRHCAGMTARHNRLLQRDEGDEFTFVGEREGCAEGEIQGTFVGGQEKDREHLEGQRPIAAEFFLFCGDMAPIELMGRILDEDVSSGDNKYGKAILIAGAFHSRMQALTKANESNEDMARWLVSPCYGRDDADPTERNLSYFFDFSDPTVPEIQVNAIIAAVYRYVYRCMEKAGQAGASPVTAYKWMAARSLESPMAMNLFRLVHDWEVVQMHRNAARSNDYDRQISAKKLTLPILVTTNSVDYVRNSFDHLRDWHVRWPALAKKLVRDFCFTVKNETGVDIEEDLAFEKYVRLIREETGKVFPKGNQLKAEHASVTSVSGVNDDGRKHAIRSLRGEEPAIKQLNDFTKDPRAVRAFVGATLLLEDSKIFEPGRSVGEDEEDDITILRSVSTGDPLDGALLKVPLIADKCITDYGTRYHIDTQHEVVRRKKDMGLVPIRGTSDNVKESIDKVVKLATSIVEKDVLASGIKEDIYNEFMKLEPYLSRRQKDKIPRLTSSRLKSTSKKSLAKVLVGLRKQCFPRRPEAKDNLEKAARESEGGLGTSAASRQETLDHVHFSGRGCDAMNDATFNELKEFPNTVAS